jgi:hypothetical protein
MLFPGPRAIVTEQSAVVMIQQLALEIQYTQLMILLFEKMCCGDLKYFTQKCKELEDIVCLSRHAYKNTGKLSYIRKL